MFGKYKALRRLTAVFVLLMCFVSPAMSAQRSAKSTEKVSRSAKTKSKTAEKSAKNGENKHKVSKSKTKQNGRNTKSVRKRRKNKRRRGTRYTSSAESEETKRAIAAETQRLELNPDLSGDVPELANDKLVWPLKYGYIARGIRRGHSGIDMMACAGDPVYAVADGVVERIRINSRDYSGYGKVAIIRHEGRQLWSWYSHCSAIYLYEGQSVRRGQKIAAVGRTGRATSNHLHFELRGAGNKVLNPLNYLPTQGALGRKYVPH